ncbi:MAG: hypothetical protein KC421_09435, partial [Anaerolineales bacterium]|nr:hypothetical protein [Anaerolineales bacterium]
MNETIYAILLILVEILFLYFTLRALRGAGMSSRSVSALGVGFVLWLGLAYVLLSQNFFSGTAVPQLSFGAVVIFPIVLGLLAQRFWGVFGTAVDAISTETFLSLQQMRFPFGVMFFLT